jgi:CRP-like cAMP-binding protein
MPLIFQFLVNDGKLEVRHGGNEMAIHEYVRGDSFGESSLIFERPRSSTVICASDTCTLHEMVGSDFLAVLDSHPDAAASLRDMCRKRLFKKAVKTLSLEKKRGLTNADIVAAFHEADTDGSGLLSFDEIKKLMHRMDPTIPEQEIRSLLNFVDIDEDGLISLEEYLRLFRSFEHEEIGRKRY